MDPVRCEWVRRFLGPWQDGELDPAVSARIETHVAGCSECAGHARFEAWFSAEVRRVADRPTAPERLADGISQALRREERNRRLRRVIVGYGGLAAAATLAVVWAFGVRDDPSRAASSSAGTVVANADAEGVGGGAPSSLPAPSASAPLSPAGDDPDSVAADLVDRHERAGAQALPLELASADSDAVSSWFQGKVPFRVVAPSLGDAGIRLAGGRLTHVRDSDAAMLRYEAGASPVTVLVFPADVPIGGQAIRVVEGRRVFTGRRHGLNYASFRMGNLAYSLVSDLPESALLDLAGRMIGGVR